MNKAILMGRLTRDPEIRYTQGQDQMCIARYTLAVDRIGRRDADQTADFISCIAFGKNGEFAEKYLNQGTKIVIVGHITTGSYTNKDNKKVYTTDVVVDEHYFAETKASSAYLPQQSAPSASDDGFMNIPDGIDEELPFN